MYIIGEQISFFDVNEDFEYLDKIKTDLFIEECTWYTVVSSDNDSVTVLSASGLRQVTVLYEEYQIHNKTSLKNTLDRLKNNEHNTKYADVCKKIQQLYIKHNATNPKGFKFNLGV